jgi:MFS family permease
VFLALSFFCVALSGGSTGKVMFTLYYILHGISQAGINSALINMIFDYVPHERRVDSLAVCQAFSGLSGFLTTLLAGALISSIQKSGGAVFGVTVYAQQVTSLIGAIITVFAIIYIRWVVMKRCKK